MNRLLLRLWSAARVPASLLTIGLTCLAASGQSVEAVPNTPGYHVVEGVPFLQADDATYLADFYVPEGSGPFPAILFIHGGGWRGGDRKQLRRQAIFMAQHGMVGMAIDYRLAPAHPFPAALADSRSGLAFLRAHAAQYHVDPSRIALVGSSAGAHLAALTATTAGQPGKGVPDGVQAVVAFNGIFDFAAMPPSTMVSDFLGGSCSARHDICTEASPVDHVHPGLPAFLVLHGTADKTAPYEQAKAFVDKLKAAGNSVELFTADGAPHTFWAEKKWLVPTEQAMCVFLRAKLEPGNSFAEDCSDGTADTTHLAIPADLSGKSPVPATNHVGQTK